MSAGRREPPGVFRAEAIKAAADRNAGPPAGLVPASSVWLAALAGLGVVVLGLVACLAEFPQRLPAQGVVLPVGGLVDIVAARASLVAATHVAVGDQVAGRDPLVTLNRERSSDADEAYFATQLRSLVREANARARGAAAESNQAQLRREQLRDEIAATRSALESEKRALGSLQREYRAVATKLRGLRQLAADGLVPRFSVLTEEASLARLSGEIDRANAELVGRSATLERLELELSRTREAEEARRSAVEAERQEQHRRTLQVRDSRSEVLLAPLAGRVVRVALRKGEFAAAGAILMRLSRTRDPLQVRLYVPSAGLAELAVNQPVRLQYAAYPIERFGFAAGVIEGIADVPLGAGQAPVGPADPALFEVRVALDRQSLFAEGREWPLRAEMLVTADVVVARRTLAERLLRPLRRS